MTTLRRPRAAPGRSARPYPQPDLLLGRYRLLEQIGSGGHGTVWIARDQERRRRVAVKRIPCGRGDPRERLRIEREGRAAARLDHPAIVALYDTGDDAGAHYLISELVEGSSLAALYRGGGLATRTLLRIGSVLADALAHAHDRGVVHRDVKPQNVIVPAHPSPGDPPAKLTDFGIARLTGEHPLTGTGDVIGTFEYMAPEQAEGRTAGPEADLYSLALTLYEGFAGANPLRGKTVAATALRLGAVIPPLARVRPDLPARLCAAIDHALAPAPGSRGTLAQLRAALEAASSVAARRRGLTMGRLGSSRAHARMMRWTPSPRARSLLGAVVGGTVSGLAVTGVLGAHSAAVGAVVGGTTATVVAASPGVGWLLTGLAAAGWLGASGRPGTALVVCVALAPVPILLPDRPWLWSLPALGPLLGVLGVAACAPVLAGRLGGRAVTRGVLGALSYWWLAMAETLTGHRLLLGAGPGVAPHASWQASLPGAIDHALIPLWTDGRLLMAAVWALGAILLPWLVRSQRAELRAVAAVAWAGALILAGGLVATRVGVSRPPFPLAIGALAAVLAFAVAAPRDHPHQSPNVA